MTRKIHWLEAMRAVAACWVLLLHAQASVVGFIGPMEGIGQQVIANGFLGVDFFFVLSGFIIAFSSHRLLETGRGFGDYARARLIRIYVPYLPIGIAMLALYSLAPDLSASHRSPGMLTSLTLLPTLAPPALSVAWTLIHEMLFYALFSFIFVSRRLLWLALATWALVIIVCWANGRNPESGIRYLVSPLNLCFLLGVCLYYLTRRGVPGFVAAACGVLGVSLVLWEASRVHADRVMLALGFGGIIVAALSRQAQRWSPGRYILFIGAASYSIYLVHNPIASVCARVLVRFLPDVAPTMALVLTSIVCLMGGLGYYYFYERNALVWARNRFKRNAAKTPVPETAPGEARHD